MSMYAVATKVTTVRSTARAASPAGGHPPPPAVLRLVRGGAGAPARRSRAVFWRRRTVVLLLAVAFVVAARGLTGWALVGPVRVPAGQAIPASERSYVVQEDDTLWGIARALQPGGDVRPIVDRLHQSRHGRPLRAGERIVLP